MPENIAMAREIQKNKLKLIRLIDPITFRKIAREWTEEEGLQGPASFHRRQQIEILSRFLENKAEKREILKIPLLLIEEFVGDSAKDARQLVDNMIKKNMPLVASIAWKFCSSGQHLVLEDLIQEGSIGLMEAIEKFDPERGTTFATFATWWIYQAITRAIKNTGRTIRVPVHYIDEKKKMPFAISWETVIIKSDKNGKEKTLGDILPDYSSERELESKWREQVIEIALNDLLEREKIVIKLRFGLANGREWTLQEIGDELGGLSRERARQIERDALVKLNHPKRKKLLQDLL